jgi:MoxR-like ATPase
MEPDAITHEIAELSQTYSAINRKLAEFIVGNRQLIDLIMVAMLAEGHILIEGVPGTAKTTIAKSMAIITGCNFNRIQGAIDMQPADMIGVRIFNQETREFVLNKGPVFTNILLADEINRVNPKSQSAFIEAMSEHQATIDGTTLPLPSPFFVIATQNPFEFEGTFPLIEAQRDRFMFNISSAYMNEADELDIIRRLSRGHLEWNQYAATLTPLLSPDLILHQISVVSQVTIEEPILQYIRNIVIATREHPDVQLGASTRASIALVRGGKGIAAIQNRTYVLPDDIKQITKAVLAHRLILKREAEVEGMNPGTVLDDIMTTVEVP